jgi:hypothetical protein
MHLKRQQQMTINRISQLTIFLPKTSVSTLSVRGCTSSTICPIVKNSGSRPGQQEILPAATLLQVLTGLKYSKGSIKIMGRRQNDNSSALPCPHSLQN